jgi:hypothetical protein
MRLICAGARMTTDFPTIAAVRSYDDLITAIVAVKNFFGLSNESLEDLAGLCRGHFDKVAGPTRVKKAGPMVIDALLGALAIELIVKPNPAAAERMSHRWQRRQEMQVREPARLSAALLARAAAELGRRGAAARRQARRRNGHANDHAAAKMSRSIGISIAVYRKRERDRLQAKRTEAGCAAAERRRNRLRMRRVRARTRGSTQV